MRLIYPTIIAIFAFFCAIAHAGEKLSWHDCVSMVARQNPDIHAANEQLSSSENLAKAAYSGFLPQVSANAEFATNSAAVAKVA